MITRLCWVVGVILLCGMLMLSLSGCPDPAASPESGWGFELTIDQDPEDGEHWVTGTITFYWKSEPAPAPAPAETPEAPQPFGSV